MLLIAG
jgi:hypothetical protein